VVETVALGQVCGGQSGNGTGLCLIEFYYDRFVVDRVAMGRDCV